MYTVGSSDSKLVTYKLCALIPSHIVHRQQFKVFSRFMIHFIMLYVVTKVGDKFFHMCTWWYSL